MAVLPRYRRLGVQAEAPTRIDYSPMREVAGLGQAISQNVDRMSDFIYREQTRRAELAGQEAVREQGALPILQRLQEQGGPGISIAEQAAYETANRVAVAEIQFEAENQISALLQSASDNNTPFSAVNTQLEDIVDGFSASLGYLNPEAAGLLQARLRNSTADASRRYASVYQTRARAAAAERRADVATGFATSALELARVEGSTPELLYSTLQENRQALIDSGMSEEHADRWFNNAYGAAVRDNTLFRAMTAPLDDVRASIETPPTEPLPGMTYADTLTEYNRISTIYNSRIAGYETDARALASRIDTARTVLSDGGIVGPEAMAEMLVEAERLEFLTPDLRAAAEDLQADAAFIGNVRGMNMAELQAARAAYASGMPGVGEPGIDMPEEVARRDIIDRQLNLVSAFMTAQRDALAGGNGLVYAQAQGVMIEDPTTGEPRVVGQPINLTGDIASVRASLDQRFREVDFIQDRFGAGGQSVLLPQEKAMIEGILTEGQPGQRAVILGMIADQGAERAERIFRSLDMNKPDMRLFSHIGSLMTSGNERAAALALRGMDVEQPPALTDMEVSRAWRAQTGAAFAYLPNTAEAMRETARFIYAEAASRDPALAEMIRPNEWDNAMMMAMGDLKIETINRNPVLMESVISPDLVTDWLSDPTDLPNIVVNDQELGDYSFNVLNQGRWYPVAVGQDQYELRTGEGVNSVPWVDSNNRPVLISLYRLSTIMSYPEDANQ